MRPRISSTGSRRPRLHWRPAHEYSRKDKQADAGGTTTSSFRENTMTKLDIEKFLMCLRIKGFGKSEAIREAMGASAEEVQGSLAALVARQLAEETKVGDRLSPAGRTEADKAFERERAGLDQRIFAQRYEDFSPINDAFKQLVTRWQMRVVGDRQVRNDHTDAAYDKSVLEGFDPIHRDISDLIATIAASAPR